MEKINVVIVEDKLLIAEGIASVLRKRSMNVMAIYGSGEEAIASLERQLPDLILMDIQLAGAYDGIATAKLISEKYSIPVIYLSDYTDDATVTRAIKTFPAAYLAKPFNDADLIRSINIAFTNANESGKIQKNILRDHFFVKYEDMHIKLAYSDIVYLEAAGAYCKIITADRTYLHSTSMNHVVEQFQRANFIRVHRSYVVNTDKITKIDGNRVFLGEREVPMSKSMRDDLVGKLTYLK